MKILAADTALGACSVAVLDGARVLAHRFEAMERGHAEALAPMVEDAMRSSSVTFADLDRLAVTTGPGTFTGQRVGLAFMRGLRVALKRPLIGVTTLEAMCAAAQDETRLEFAAAVHDARRGEAYLAVASRDGLLIAPEILLLDDVARRIAEAIPPGAAVAICGTAAETVATKLKQARVTSIRQPDALWVARLALSALEPSGAPHPLYLRAPDAKLPASA
ncbi:MAG TPA: tRNA (adenosine(37)-N6)-threonylcarbamoyltransferase complex dimerization subunit type 1 TsaB [Rhizomicrobium sp.]|nr:tRNA (adenosine(37)-N6)-threonylcarbamoyltransferase complex dimerization subunit type 1 TsaB [Rhizomicrobium sp.]